jgi:hypothetical protein
MFGTSHAFANRCSVKKATTPHTHIHRDTDTQRRKRNPCAMCTLQEPVSNKHTNLVRSLHSRFVVHIKLTTFRNDFLKLIHFLTVAVWAGVAAPLTPPCMYLCVTAAVRICTPVMLLHFLHCLTENCTYHPTSIFLHFNLQCQKHKLRKLCWV